MPAFGGGLAGTMGAGISESENRDNDERVARRFRETFRGGLTVDDPTRNYGGILGGRDLLTQGPQSQNVATRDGAGGGFLPGGIGQGGFGQQPDPLAGWEFPMMGGQAGAMGGQGSMPQIAPPMGMGAPPMNLEALYAMYNAPPGGIMPGAAQPPQAPPQAPVVQPQPMPGVTPVEPQAQPAPFSMGGMDWQQLAPFLQRLLQQRASQ